MTGFTRALTGTGGILQGQARPDGGWTGRAWLLTRRTPRPTSSRRGVLVGRSLRLGEYDLGTEYVDHD